MNEIKEDKIISELVKINERLAVIEVDLKYHIKRTDLLEDKIQEEVKEVNKKLNPIHKAHTVAVGLIKLVLLAGAISTAILKIKGF